MCRSAQQSPILNKQRRHSGTGICNHVPVYLAQFLYFLAICIAAPVYPSVMNATNVAGGDKLKGASLWSLSLVLNGTFELLSAGFLGELSDHFGRKPFLCISIVGQIIDFGTAMLCTADADYSFSFLNSTAAILTARSIAGACGLLPIFARAYVADVSSEEEAAVNFGRLFGLLGLALAVGPGIGGVVYHVTGLLRAPMLLACGMNLLNLCVVLLFLTESLPLASRTPRLRWASANPIGSLRFLCTTKRSFLFAFAFMSFLDAFSLQMLLGVMRPFTDVAYHFSVEQFSAVMVTSGVCLTFSAACLLPPFLYFCGELVTMQIGYVLSFSGQLLYGLLYYAGDRAPPALPPVATKQASTPGGGPADQDGG